jgi:cysteinyl-tRNA synthetase
MSGVLALINELLKSDHSKEDVLATILDFDRVLGLDLEKSLKGEKLEPKEDPELEKLLKERIEAKKEKDYDRADKLRNNIEKLGYKVLDTKKGQKLEKI